MYSFVLSTIRATCPTHPILLDLIILITLGHKQNICFICFVLIESWSINRSLILVSKFFKFHTVTFMWWNERINFKTKLKVLRREVILKKKRCFQIAGKRFIVCGMQIV
jgi:hypothetical protein